MVSLAVEYDIQELDQCKIERNHGGAWVYPKLVSTVP